MRNKRGSIEPRARFRVGSTAHFNKSLSHQGVHNKCYWVFKHLSSVEIQLYCLNDVSSSHNLAGSVRYVEISYISPNLSGIFSANAIVSHCYVCSNVDSIRILSNIQDKQWKVWLKNLSTEPQTEDCLDEFTVS